MASCWALGLAITPLAIIVAETIYGLNEPFLVLGLLAFGAVFAVNSSLHSFLIVDYAREDGVSLDVGFYYMANAAGRLIGTVLSGWVYQNAGLLACLWISTGFIIVSAFVVRWLPSKSTDPIAASD